MILTFIQMKGINLNCWWRATCVQTIWNNVWFNSMAEITYRHNAQHHLCQSEDWLVSVSLTTNTCSVCCNMLFHIFGCIGHHFKLSVDDVFVSFQLGCHFCDKAVVEVFVTFCDKALVITFVTAVGMLFSF